MIRARDLFRTKTYLAKIMLLTSTAILLIVVVLSFVVYINAQHVLTNNEYAANKKILYQVKYNMDMMTQTVSSLCKFLYLNRDVSAVMYAKEEDMVNVAVRMNQIISSATSASPYIHSIRIYNRELNQVYNAGSPLFFEDKLLQDFIDSKLSLPQLKPVFRDIKKLVNQKSENEPVFSFFIYETGSMDEKPNGVVVVNVKPEWLFENIKQINMIDNLRGDSVFILDSYGEYVDDGTSPRELMEWRRTMFKAFKEANHQVEPDGFFKSKYNGTSYLVNYMNVESAGITLLKTQPVSEVYKSINSLKTGIILIAVIFLVMAVSLSIGISRKIYQPFGKLVSSIISDRINRFDEDIVVDEISYLDFVYRESMERLDLYDKRKDRYKDVMKHYWLNRMLTESLSISSSELTGIFKEMSISLPVDGPYAVVILKLDKFKDFHHKFRPKDRDTIRFALINITSEIIAREYRNEGLDMKDDHVVFIINTSDNEVDYHSHIYFLVKEAQETFSQFFKISCTASISDPMPLMSDLSANYHIALDQTVHRFFLGHHSIITSGYTQAKESSNKTGYSKNLEERLLETIQSRNLPAVEQVLALIFEELTSLSYHNALVSIIKLADVIKETLENMKVKAAPSLLIELSSISRNIVEKETLGEIYKTIISLLHDSLVQNPGETANGVNYFIVDAVTDYIHNHFHEPSLCLTSIATMMKLPSRRLNRIFKEATLISIPDFINEIRLVKAAELLIQQNLSVHEAVERVGILNETYFFSLFKKRFGATPKEYALQRNVHNLNSKQS